MLSEENFLGLMEELRLLLAETEVERYNYFVQNSADGRQCPYAKKSLLIFQKREQRQQLEAKLREVIALMDHTDDI